MICLNDIINMGSINKPRLNALCGRVLAPQPPVMTRFLVFHGRCPQTGWRGGFRKLKERCARRESWWRGGRITWDSSLYSSRRSVQKPFSEYRSWVCVDAELLGGGCHYCCVWPRNWDHTEMVGSSVSEDGLTWLTACVASDNSLCLSWPILSVKNGNSNTFYVLRSVWRWVHVTNVVSDMCSENVNNINALINFPQCKLDLVSRLWSTAGVGTLFLPKITWVFMSFSGHTQFSS